MYEADKSMPLLSLFVNIILLIMDCHKTIEFFAKDVC